VEGSAPTPPATTSAQKQGEQDSLLKEWISNYLQILKLSIFKKRGGL